MKESNLSVFAVTATLLVVAGAGAAKGQFAVASSAETGSGFAGFVGWSIEMGWCHHSGSQLLTGDFNGDGRADLLCHDVSSGTKWFAYSTF
ncbi:FG-GAP repeat protein [Myxococcus stipitatus]|uniref:FG-GAP repeat protein n=1 Tax=Myxococcus stipitatus TaxID=83455 RepID=UPI0030D2AD45